MGWNILTNSNQYQINMETELTQIKKWWQIYTNPKSEVEFYRAEKELNKVHSKYGTIDINIIKSLIN